MSYSNSNLTGVAYNSAKAFVKPSINFNSEAAILEVAASSNSAWWDLIYSSSNVYGARGTLGVSIIDVSTPASSSESFNSAVHNLVGGTVGYRCMGVTLIGSTLVSVARAGSYETTGIGYLETWDASTPASTTSQDVYSKNTTDALEALPHLYSAIDNDGTYVYVSGQKSGFYVFDVSTPTAITLRGSLTSGDWETQGLAVSGGYAFTCNYVFGLRIIDLADTTNPGAVTDRVIAAPSYNSVQLRPWQAVADGGYLYVSNNVSNINGDSVERGLLVLDISDPTTIATDGSDWIRAKVPDADQDEWNSQGDRPYLGITKNGDYVYIAAGHGGVFVWDVSDPTSPKYKGVIGTHTALDNIYTVTAWRDNGEDYLCYGDGQNTNIGSHKLYTDRVIK